MQKHVNLVDLVKSFPTNIYLQNLAPIQKRTSPRKFDHLAEKSESGSVSNLSTKARGPAAHARRGARDDDRRQPDRLARRPDFHARPRRLDGREPVIRLRRSVRIAGSGDGGRVAWGRVGKPYYHFSKW